MIRSEDIQAVMEYSQLDLENFLIELAKWQKEDSDAVLMIDTIFDILCDNLLVD